MVTLMVDLSVNGYNGYTQWVQLVPVETKVLWGGYGKRALSAYLPDPLVSNGYGKFPLGVPVEKYPLELHKK